MDQELDIENLFVESKNAVSLIYSKKKQIKLLF